MIGRRAVIGLSLLSALLVCAFAAQSASAIVTKHSTNTTVVTCVKVGDAKQEFKDAHCDEKHPETKGDYAHKTFTEVTKITATNANITGGTKTTEPAILKGTIGLAKVTIECAVVENNAEKSTITNTEPEAKQHTFSGKVVTEFSTCTVKELLKCETQKTIISDATVTGVEGMHGPKEKLKEGKTENIEPNAMGIEFAGQGVEKLFATVEFKNKGAEACSLNGKSFPITGSVVGTNGPTTESAQEGKGAGATLVFTPKFSMETLKLGPNAATFETIVTPTNSTTKTPLSMTTGT